MPYPEIRSRFHGDEADKKVRASTVGPSPASWLSRSRLLRSPRELKVLQFAARTQSQMLERVSSYLIYAAQLAVQVTWRPNPDHSENFGPGQLQLFTGCYLGCSFPNPTPSPFSCDHTQGSFRASSAPPLIVTPARRLPHMLQYFPSSILVAGANRFNHIP